MDIENIQVKSASSRIRLDAAEIIRWCEALKSDLEGLTLEDIPEGLREQLFNLADSGFLHSSISVMGSTTIAGDHVIRLGVGGQLESIAAAVRALKANCVG